METRTTTQDDDLARAVLAALLAEPAAAFHETRVAARIVSFLRDWDIPYHVDPWGALVARVRRGDVTRPLVLMAHMDHPGLELADGVIRADGYLTATLLGGVARAALTVGAVGVRLYAPHADRADRGILTHVVEAGPASSRGMATTLILALDDAADAGRLDTRSWGVWEMPTYRLDGKVVHARAVDDLAGCAAILAALHEAARATWDTDLYAVFTRAEEVGLVGAHAALHGGTVPSGAYVVSLEASKVLPGALQGDGPVIRVGDRISTFSDEAEGLLRQAATGLSGPVQRQLMNGGVCEAASALQAGFAATGLAFPLGNYHNVSPETTLVPETIHLSDYHTGVALLVEAARLLPDYRGPSGRDASPAMMDAQIERLAATAKAVSST